MALVECSKCKQSISDKSIKCIHCGFRMKKIDNKYKIILLTSSICLVLIILAIILKLFINNKDDKKVRVNNSNSNFVYIDYYNDRNYL